MPDRQDFMPNRPHLCTLTIKQTQPCPPTQKKELFKEQPFHLAGTVPPLHAYKRHHAKHSPFSVHANLSRPAIINVKRLGNE